MTQTKEKPFCLEDYKEHDLVNGVRMRVFPETIIKQALAELMKEVLELDEEENPKIFWREEIEELILKHFGKSLMSDEVKA